MAKKKPSVGERIAWSIADAETYLPKEIARKIDAAVRRAFRDGMVAAPLNRGDPVDAFGASLAAKYGVKL